MTGGSKSKRSTNFGNVCLIQEVGVGLWMKDERFQKFFTPCQKFFPSYVVEKKIEIERVISFSESITDDLETLKKG